MSHKNQTGSQKGQDKNPGNKYIVFMAIGMELVGLVFVSVYLGQFFDSKYGLKGFATAGFTLLSLIGWVIHIILLVRKIEKLNQ